MTSKEKAKAAKNKMRVMLKNASIKLLEETWQLTEKMSPWQFYHEGGTIIRGLVMDELEKRYPEKFDQWLENEDFGVFA